MIIDASAYVVPAILLLACIFGGAFSKSVRIPWVTLVIKAVSALLGLVPFLVYYAYALSALGLAGWVPLAIGMPVAVGALFASLWLVEYGESLGARAGVAFDSALREASSRTREGLSDLLSEFGSRMMADLQKVADATQSSVSSATGFFDQRAKVLEERLEDLRKELVALVSKYDSLARNYSTAMRGYEIMLKERKEAMASIQRELGLLTSEREQLKALKEVYERLNEVLEERTNQLKKGSGGSPPTEERSTLTSEDREASRKIGLEAEHEFAEYFRRYGFEVDERVGEGDPDLVLRISGKPVAIVNTKSYMLYDEPKRNQRKIGLDSVVPEMASAGRLKLPLVLAVKNRRNGRTLLHLLSYEKLADWQGISTPLLLSKDDQESGRQLEEMAQRVLRELGAKA
jgi:hypothetical protein